jgi:hypothetical protein
MKIHSGKPLQYTKPSGKGAKISDSDGTGLPRLQSAVLAINGTPTYAFNCTANSDCLTIGYDCKNGQCKTGN